MSHFTVLVVGNDPEEQLKPFQENNMCDCPEEYITFNDVEDDHLKQYNEKSTEKAVMPDGTLHNTFDPEYKNHPVKEMLLVKSVPFKELYSSFEEFVKDWHGSSKRDEKTNRYGYWENPNAKWDWYQLGGRWTGFFQMNKDRYGSVGNPGLMTKVPVKGTADQAFKKDIDFDKMRKLSAQKASDTYKMIEDEFDGTIPKLTLRWEDLMDSKNETYNKLDIQVKRDMYHNQAAMVEWKSRAGKYQASSKIDKYFEKLYSILVWDSPGDFEMSKEEYIQKHVDSSISTFAVLMDGKWYERGTMGWWAMISNEKGDWDKEYSKLLDSVSDDTLLSIYDCHI